MPYVDQTSLYVYKKLLTHQDLDAAAENSKLHEDLLTAVTDFNNNLKFNNAKYITGEVNAGATYKKLIGIDSSDVVQLGEAGTQVKVPADPTTALGVATKQYVDGVQMFQTQAVVSVAPGGSGTLATILSLSATTRGIIHSIWHLKGNTGGTLRLKITLDSVVVIDDTSPSIASGDYASLSPNGTILDTNVTDDATAAQLIELRFNSTCLIEAAISDAGSTSTVQVLYSKIP